MPEYPELERSLLSQVKRLETLKEPNKGTIKGFLDRYLIKNRLSVSRQIRVLITLRQLAEQGYSLAKLTEKDLETINVAYAKKKASLHTVKTTRDIIKAFLRWQGSALVSSQELKSKSPYSNPEYRLQFSDLPSPEEISQLIGASTPKMAAMLALFVGSGCRLGAARFLKRKSCIWDNGNGLTIEFVSKNQTNTVWVRPDLALIIQKWFNVSPFKEPEDLVFPNPLGKTISPSAINKELERAQKKAGITKHLHPHLFRHYHASELLNMGVPETFIKSRLWNNQASMELHRVYGHLNKTSETEAIKQAFGYSQKKDETPQSQALNVQKCFSCGKTYPFTVSVCECGLDLNPKRVLSKQQEMEGNMLALQEQMKMVLVALQGVQRPKE